MPFSRQVMNPVFRAVGDLGYRLGLGPQPSDVPDHRLVELVEGSDKLTPGRALDLGCGTGRNAIYLARHGWETIGVEMVGYAMEVARRQAAAQEIPVRFIQGDVTRLADLGIDTKFTLLMDGGCYHMIPTADVTHMSTASREWLLRKRVSFSSGSVAPWEPSAGPRLCWRVFPTGDLCSSIACQASRCTTTLRARRRCVRP
ncbi:MAG: class I SAM-dependent methyltransferase [Mycobacterium sp.]